MSFPNLTPLSMTHRAIAAASFTTNAKLACITSQPSALFRAIVTLPTPTYTIYSIPVTTQTRPEPQFRTNCCRVSYSLFLPYISLKFLPFRHPNTHRSRCKTPPHHDDDARPSVTPRHDQRRSFGCRPGRLWAGKQPCRRSRWEPRLWFVGRETEDKELAQHDVAATEPDSRGGARLVGGDGCRRRRREGTETGR